MNKIKATYKIVTPMFIGGADNKQAELRGPSFKGVLRFWFRAIALSELKSVKEVKMMGKKLFGSTDGQAKFLLDVCPEGNIVECEVGKRWNGKGSAYLGYGVIGKDKNTRSYIKENCRFKVTLILKKGIEKKEFKYLKLALIAVGLFGGLGSRSRKGFGSVCLEQLQHNEEIVWDAPHNAIGLKEKINNLFRETGKLFGSLPEYSAFSKESTISIYQPSGDCSDALALLDQVGKEMLRYRSYGRRKRGKDIHELPWGEEAEQIFKDDHDLILGVSKGIEPQIHPRRVVFGLPHNYFYSGNTKIDVNSSLYERRASPLFIHIHELGDKYVAVFTILPAVFLPEGDGIKIGGKSRNERKYNTKVQVDYTVLTDFVKRFPGIMEVL